MNHWYLIAGMLDQLALHEYDVVSKNYNLPFSGFGYQPFGNFVFAFVV